LLLSILFEEKLSIEVPQTILQTADHQLVNSLNPFIHLLTHPSTHLSIQSTPQAFSNGQALARSPEQNN
jgi:hypothetical protein